jgi:hypothetical protein
MAVYMLGTFHQWCLKAACELRFNRINDAVGMLTPGVWNVLVAYRSPSA